ncbi:hypothetical protein SJI19_03010 [Acerihabitans sp. TG2]|uniref:hypothetical protein n=1 Tax=Acerihabitans sp. TG2 TaxID=3096008 RepID=UPI002B23662F|nr:hypothetical protein [Acerihabitans sp. TG2]MEA9389530.1 hypothetical protein [Acerihabitans sp. TG2]
MKSISYEEFQQNLPYWLAYLRDGGELSVKQAGQKTVKPSANDATSGRSEGTDLLSNSIQVKGSRKLSFKDALETTRTRHANTIKILGDK